MNKPNNFYVLSHLDGIWEVWWIDGPTRFFRYYATRGQAEQCAEFWQELDWSSLTLDTLTRLTEDACPGHLIAPQYVAVANPYPNLYMPV